MDRSCESVRFGKSVINLANLIFTRCDIGLIGSRELLEFEDCIEIGRPGRSKGKE